MNRGVPQKHELLFSDSLASRRVSVYRDAHVLETFQALVGAPATPTGQFSVEETLQMAPGHPGGPFAPALSTRSNALQEFEGGPGPIALHGRNNLTGALGSGASHDCVHLDTASIDWLAARIVPGIATTIHADHHA
jgi:lipoprotein-anchoring transpeptidase ErfK/SrfK